MAFQDSKVFDKIDQIGEFYSRNIDNNILRPAYTRLVISREDWEHINAMANQTQYEKTKGYTFYEMYQMIISMARFISRSRNELAPNIRGILSGSSSGGSNDIIRDMIISNFRANLDVLADMVHELYILTAQLDKDSHKVKAPVYTRMTELAGIGSLLVSK